jgi:predicted  nucleic acid-binding Zn-ribbon protein
MYSFQTQGKIEEINSELKEIELEINKLTIEIESFTKAYDNTKSEYIKSENKLTEMRKQFDEYTQKSKASSSLSLFIMFIISFILAIYSGSILGIEGNLAAGNSFRNILYGVSALLGLSCLGFVIRSVRYKLRKKYFNRLKTDIIGINENNSKKFDEMDKLKDDWKSNEKLIEEMQKIITELRKEIGFYSQKLEEPFV